jgi:hypothetical protein
MSARARCRSRVSAKYGNHSRAIARHCPVLSGGPPGASPAASAAAVYLRTVCGSTPRLRATATFARPAYQCS